jgi:dephospho-CoA kinase
MEKKNLRLCIIGHGGHGKDQLAEIISELCGLKYCSSSWLAAELFIFDALRATYGYKTIEECFADRLNHRAEWHDLISEYNADDKAKLAKKLLERADIYVGMRCDMELDACDEQGLFDSVIWVDASERVPPESIDSCKVTKNDADLIIDNNKGIEELRANAETLISYLMGPFREMNEIQEMHYKHQQAVDKAVEHASVFIANSIPAYGSDRVLIVPSGSDGEYDVLIGGRACGTIQEANGYVTATVKLCP